MRDLEVTDCAQPRISFNLTAKHAVNRGSAYARGRRDGRGRLLQDSGFLGFIKAAYTSFK
jgi:hypothetical protein